MADDEETGVALETRTSDSDPKINVPVELIAEEEFQKHLVRQGQKFLQGKYPFAIFSPEHKFFRLNKTFAELLGYTVGELLGKSIEGYLVEPELPHKFRQILSNLVNLENLCRYHSLEKDVFYEGCQLWSPLSRGYLRKYLGTFNEQWKTAKKAKNETEHIATIKGQLEIVNSTIKDFLKKEENKKSAYYDVKSNFQIKLEAKDGHHLPLQAEVQFFKSKEGKYCGAYLWLKERGFWEVIAARRQEKKWVKTAYQSQPTDLVFLVKNNPDKKFMRRLQHDVFFIDFMDERAEKPKPTVVFDLTYVKNISDENLEHLLNLSWLYDFGLNKIKMLYCIPRAEVFRQVEEKLPLRAEVTENEKMKKLKYSPRLIPGSPYRPELKDLPAEAIAEGIELKLRLLGQ